MAEKDYETHPDSEAEMRRVVPKDKLMEMKYTEILDYGVTR